MGYYRGAGDCLYGRGDYYQGDYYRGDVFGVLKKVGKFVKKAVVTAAKLTPAGRVITALTGGRGLPSHMDFQRITPGGFPGGFGGPAFPPPPMSAPEPVGTMTSNCFYPGFRLRGTRPNKSGYYKQVTKGDPTEVQYIPKGSVCVTNRRLNVANPRALRRSIRRAQGFAKLARRVMTFVNAKAPKGRAKFKRGR